MSRCFRRYVRFSIVFALIILLFSFTANSALSATTTKTIQGTAPYLSSILTAEIQSSSFSLLGFTFGGKDYDDTNLSSLYIDPHKYSPATLKAAITGKVIKSQLSATEALDDDGDGNFELSAKTPSSLSVAILNSSGGDISGNTSLFSDSLCSSSSSYKVKIKISGDLSLTTAYGDPRNKDYNATKEYTFSVVGACRAKPGSMLYARGNYAGPESMWDGGTEGGDGNSESNGKGFKAQSSYAENFPTTGANNLYFDLGLVGVDKELTWAAVTEKGITATMSNITATSVRVTLTGPSASASQKTSDTPGKVSKPTLPATIELIGKDGSKEVIKYGFVITQWFINRGTKTAPATGTNSQTAWCSKTGYLIARVQDLTNASGTAYGNGGTIPIADPPRPASSSNYYQRRIGGGLFSEWGNVGSYKNSDWSRNFYWTSDLVDEGQLRVYSGYGSASSINASYGYSGACRSQ